MTATRTSGRRWRASGCEFGRWTGLIVAIGRYETETKGEYVVRRARRDHEIANKTNNRRLRESETCFEYGISKYLPQRRVFGA
jgi:hypothetical protein